jgi:hypothetical protein
VGGKKLVETVIEFDDEDDKEAFLAECHYSGMLDDGINAMLEFYLNLPEIMDPAQNPFSFACLHMQTAAARPTTSGPTSKNQEVDPDDIIYYLCPGDNHDEQC